jgi:hypothetical protein
MKKKTERRYGRLRLQSAFVAQLAQNRGYTQNPSMSAIACFEQLTETDAVMG